MAGQVYTVKPGDTACAIAAMSKISTQELAGANAATVAALDHLLIGQMLTIPVSTGSASRLLKATTRRTDSVRWLADDRGMLAQGEVNDSH